MAFIEPASVRHNNSGAMSLGSSKSMARKFGASEETQLNDGQGNTIATFPTKVQGAAAHLALLGSVYAGMTVRAALAKWSGGNHVDAYVKVVTSRTGLKATDTLTSAYIRDPKTGIKLAKAMAFHEAGKEYPMTAREWKQAHALAFPTQRVAWFKIPAADGPKNALGDRIADLALQQVGKGEKPGPGNYQHMNDWYDTLGLPHHEDGKTPWCKLFVSAMRKQAGAQVEDHEDPDILVARNLLKRDEQIDPKQPELIRRGDSPVWPRGNSSWQGHTGIVTDIDYDKQWLECVEGNVNNTTIKKRYTFAQIRSKALGINRPVEDKLQPDGTMSYRDVVAESPSLKMDAYAWLSGIGAAAYTYWTDITETVGSMVSALPFMAQETTTTVGAVRQIGENAGLPLSVKLMFALTVTLLAARTYRVLRERHNRGGKAR